jgi:oxygen-independent coproporphyrinogen-3 oxidase
MPPGHQRDAVSKATGGNHVANCATDTDICPNRGRFALTMSKTAANVSLFPTIGDYFEHRFTFGDACSARLGR